MPTAADRRYLVERAETDVVIAHAQAGMNTLVLAEHGMGKTTFLRHLEGRLEDETGATAVYLDGRRLGDAASILLATRDEVAGPRTQIGESLRTTTLAFTPMPVEMRNEEALRIVRELAAGAQAGKTYVLLDGPDPDIAHQLFGRLRDELWQTGLVWIVAGDSARRQQYLTPPADAFFERIVELAPLSEVQQRDLIRRRMARGDDRKLLDVRVESGNPRALLSTLRDGVAAGSTAAIIAGRDQRQRTAEALGRLESMMLAEIEDGATASASDLEWLKRFGVSRQRAQQVLARLEHDGLVRAERLPGPSGRPRKVYRRIEEQS